MSNTATKTAKLTAIETFLLGNQDKLDKVTTSAIARKIDSKDKSDNAKRFFAMNTKRTNALNDLIESFKTRLFSDVQSLYKKTIAKDFLLQVFQETDYLNSLPCVGKLQKSLTLRVKSDNVSDKRFIECLKVAISEHITKTDKSRKDKLATLSAKTKAIFTGKEKEQFLSFLADKSKKDLEKAEKANKKKETKEN